MAGFLDDFSQHEVKENTAISAFASVLNKQKEAFANNSSNNRSWVKEDGAGYTVKLGKLGRNYRFADKDAVLDFLQKASIAVHNDADFQAVIEEAYGSKSGDEPKAKRKYTKKSVE